MFSSLNPDRRPRRTQPHACRPVARRASSLYQPVLLHPHSFASDHPLADAVDQAVVETAWIRGSQARKVQPVPGQTGLRGIINGVTFIYPAGHPGVSEDLCGRARQDRLPADVASMTPQDRLRAILWNANLRGFPPYGVNDPVVSFTESRPEGLAYLIREKSWAPWGIVLDRDSVFTLGGGPVWYIRGDMLDAVIASGLTSIRPWLVRLQPGKSEWLHEREWRVPTECLELSTSHVRAVIVGDPHWSPGTRSECGMNEITGGTGWREEPPHLVQGVPRWCWNAMQSRFDVLPPWAGYPHPA